jgi:cobaltochelatase CobS
MVALHDAVPPMPDMKVSARQVFGIDSDMEVPAYSEPEGHVPDLDPDYLFDRETTLAILAGFAKNRRVMVTGYHGTGKSTHIEQVAASFRTASCPGRCRTMSPSCSTNTTPAGLT